MFKIQRETLEDSLFLLGLSSFFLLFRLGWGSLASWDEALYAGVAKDMAGMGHWFRLTLGGSPWFDKPPLSMWCTAFFYKLFGVNEFSARFFSALCGIGTVGVTYLIGRELFGRWTGFLGASVLISSLHFIRYSRFGMTDSPFVFFLCLSFYFFWLGRLRNRYLIFSGITLGLAFMTKSFAALWFFPVIVLYGLAAGELSIFGRSSFWVGMMLAVAVALPWHLYQLVVDREMFTQNVLYKHLLSRTTHAIEGHTGNAYFYIRTFVNKYHPWVLVGIFSAPWFIFKAVKDRRREVIFITSWIFVIFLIITAVRTKLPWYILPIYPALSLTVGYALAKIFSENQKVLMWGIFFLIMCIHVQIGRIFHFDYSREIKGIASAVHKEASVSDRVYLYNFHDAPAALFYLERPISYLDDAKAVLEASRSEKRFFCLIHEPNLQALQKELPATRFVLKGRYESFCLVSLD